MLSIDNIYALTIEIINPTEHTFSYHAQIIGPDAESDGPKLYESTDENISIEAHSATNFLYEISHPTLNKQLCFINNRPLKKLRIQPFLEKNPFKGTYKMHISNQERCEIFTEMIHH